MFVRATAYMLPPHDHASPHARPRAPDVAPLPRCGRDRHEAVTPGPLACARSGADASLVRPRRTPLPPRARRSPAGDRRDARCSRDEHGVVQRRGGGPGARDDPGDHAATDRVAISRRRDGSSDARSSCRGDRSPSRRRGRDSGSCRRRSRSKRRPPRATDAASFAVRSPVRAARRRPASQRA